VLKQILSTFHHFPSQSWLIIKAISVLGMGPTPRPLPPPHLAWQSQSFLQRIPVLPSEAPAMLSPGWQELLGSQALGTAGAAGVPAPRAQPGPPQQHGGGDSHPRAGDKPFPTSLHPLPGQGRMLSIPGSPFACGWPSATLGVCRKERSPYSPCHGPAGIVRWHGIHPKNDLF